MKNKGFAKLLIILLLVGGPVIGFAVDSWNGAMYGFGIGFIALMGLSEILMVMRRERG